MDTYEKKYKEALERAKKLYEQGTITESLSYVFPELVESENERIRKAQLDYWRSVGGKEWHGVPVQETIAWLEKQGEQKSADKVKVEPKFKVGDWIVWKDKCYKVNDNGCGYELIDTNGLSTSLEYETVDENAHLWTIEDAKDGDVLAFDDGHIILVKESHNSFWGWRLSCWCHLLDGEFEVVEYHTKTEGLHPATKEQHDLLFQKIREAGYEWDAEKKELKKIENSPVLSNSLNIGKDSKWSDTDEELLQHCCGAIAAADYYTLEDKEEMETWLKSLKKKMEE